MRFDRPINIHPGDVKRLMAFLKERNLTVRIAWATTSQSGAGLPGRTSETLPGQGAISGELSEPDAAELNGFIIKLEAAYFDPR
jgi:hypothetical protein